MTTGNSGQERRANEETVSIKILRQFIDLVHTLGTQNLIVKNAFEEAPEGKVRSRTFLQVAMDDLMDAYAYIAKDVQDTNRVSQSFYLTMARTRLGASLSKEDANDRLQAKMLGAIHDKYAEDADMPEFIKLIYGRVPEEVLQTLTSNWDLCLNRVQRLLTDEDTLSAEENKMTLVRAFNIRATELNQEQEHTNQIKDGAKTLGNFGQPQQQPQQQTSKGTAVSPIDAEQKNRTVEAIKKRMGELRAQLKGLGAFGSNDLETLEELLSEKNLPEAVAKRVEEELAVAYDSAPNSQEAQKIKGYLKWVANLPWNEFSDLETDLNKSEYTLDEGHYGMKEAKDAIIEHIAVEKRTGQSNGKILCLVGSPGVGKTSIGKSMAAATGREYARLSLGGVQNESAIRGHGRTYLDSRPGRIVDTLRQAGTNNPLILLDEIDKMSHGGPNGDPTAAMLEVLDPEQNVAFRDHYLGVDIDLSPVLFVATANSLGSIPAPLRDRMEIIHMPGYAHDEKIEIARRYLLPKQLAKNGLTDKDLTIADDMLGKIVSGYTRELGVRGLEKALGKIARKVATEIERGEIPTAELTEIGMTDYLGPEAITKKDVTAKGDRVGVVNGLAYSSVGGSIMNIEVVKEPGSGMALKITGNLRQVMTESIRVARVAVLENAKALNLDMAKIGKCALNVHALAGAVPKDGPSAGAAIATAMISALTEIPIRSNVAMTGEISLHGDITAIGGLPEKLNGAVQEGATKVLIPADNMKDLADVPQSILDKLEIVPVSRIEEVIAHALTQPIPELANENTAETGADATDATLTDVHNDAADGNTGEKGGNDNDAKTLPMFISVRHDAKGLKL